MRERNPAGRGNLRFGIQTALQNTTPAELRSLWRPAESAGFEWISVWDHFNAVGGGTNNLEAVSMHAALVLETSTVRCGGLVYSIGYRDVAVLAKAATTLDHLSGSRVTLGLGAGYLQSEYEAWGIEFPGGRDRLDHLEEVVQALRLLLTGAPTTFEGRHVSLRDATCDPPPVQTSLPIWIGGGGEKRTIPIAGRFADGWNVPMATIDDFASKGSVLDDAAESAGRDPADVARSVGVGLCWDPAELPGRYGDRADILRPAILTGTTDEVVTRTGGYRDAGADWLLLSLRAPFDADGLDREEVMPHFA